MCEVLEKHKAVFEEGIGMLKGFAAELQVNPGASQTTLRHAVFLTL